MNEIKTYAELVSTLIGGHNLVLDIPNHLEPLFRDEEAFDLMVSVKGLTGEIEYLRLKPMLYKAGLTPKYLHILSQVEGIARVEQKE